MIKLPLSRIWVACAFVFLSASLLHAEKLPVERLVRELTPLATCLNGTTEAFELTTAITVPIDGKPQEIDVRILRLASGDYEVAATQQDYSFVLQRKDNETTFALPHHQVQFVGIGEVDESDHLEPVGTWKRLVSLDSAVSQYLNLVLEDHANWLPVMTRIIKSGYNESKNEWVFNKNVTIQFSKEGRQIKVQGDEFTLDFTVKIAPDTQELRWNDEDYQTVEIGRAELERQLVRGVRRGFEIFAPAESLKEPKRDSRAVANGELRWVDGHRVCILSGTPEQIGKAHGEVLKSESIKTIDSVLYTFGTANTIRTGRWFRSDLEEAYSRLSPHIPDDHKRETAALAVALDLDVELTQALNVFPELFHCSGFAVFGSATKDGKLYHGRVLDYMTTIGLQDSSTTFIVSVDGKIPFANVGYAGFIGSVTGMNAKSISLGEMGGRGEGQWDGVPMATLMRRALEECSTLEEVMTLWESSPRTCEYYYVFADGKTNEAVGVAATPESIEFIKPGQGHELLGEGIKDTVVLSAGSRLEKLRERVKEKHGEIDIEAAIWLMSRPVAMKSNLHNALFIPADGILYVANADHSHPAAERPYVRLDLNELLSTKIPERTVSGGD